MIRRLLLILCLAFQPLGLFAADQLELHFVYVGQGDCTIVKTPEGRNVLIDCGSTRDGNPVEVRNYVRHVLGTGGKIDVLVVTHPDADHYNYLRGVLQGTDVDKVLFVGAPSEYTQDNFDSWLTSHADAIALTPDDISSPSTPSAHFGDGDTKFYVMAADTEGDKNTRSIVLLVSYKDFDVVLTGDATKATEKGILELYPIEFLDVELLKLGHHGSTTSSTDPWLAALRAETAVVSAGYDSQYAHPRKTVIERVEQYTDDAPSHLLRWGVGSGNNAQLEDVADYRESVFATATNGHIVVASDGESYSITTDVRHPDTFEFVAEARAMNVESMELMMAEASAAASEAAAPEAAITVEATLPPLPVELGAKIQVVTRDGTTVTGVLKDVAKPGWIGVFEAETSNLAYVRASEVIVVRKIE